jgi:hypothetical protein
MIQPVAFNLVLNLSHCAHGAAWLSAIGAICPDSRFSIFRVVPGFAPGIYFIQSFLDILRTVLTLLAVLSSTHLASGSVRYGRRRV